MKTWDVIIVGGGIIGLSLALSLRKHGADILVVDKNEPGRESTHAAAGMLAWCEQRPALRDLAFASANIYPEFVHELEDESGEHVDYRRHGTILFSGKDEERPSYAGARRLAVTELSELEPSLAQVAETWFLPESSVDPRSLASAALKAARRRGIDFATGTAVTTIEVAGERIAGVKTARTRFPARVVVNSAGAWAGQIEGPLSIPTRPVKGHMLDIIPASRLHAAEPHSGEKQGHPLLRHVVRSPGIYLVPRTNGRIVVGATVEEAGFDKRVVPETIQHLHQAAANLLPQLGEARIHETWTGLRPATPDGLPVLGRTGVEGYFIATGHFRDGILLAPITAHLMTEVVRGQQTNFDISPFSALRFGSTKE